MLLLRCGLALLWSAALIWLGSKFHAQFVNQSDLIKPTTRRASLPPAFGSGWTHSVRITIYSFNGRLVWITWCWVYEHDKTSPMQTNDEEFFFDSEDDFSSSTNHFQSYGKMKIIIIIIIIIIIKYKDLEIEIGRMWGMKATTIPVVIGGLGLIKKGLKKYSKQIRVTSKLVNYRRLHC